MKYWDSYSESAAADLIWLYLERCKFKAALAFMQSRGNNS